MESLKALRESAEAQVKSVLAQAEIEATQMRDRARIDADAYLDNARREAQEIAAEAGAMRHAAEDRVREVEKLEADFNEQVSRMTERLGIVEKPAQGWFGRAVQETLADAITPQSAAWAALTAVSARPRAFVAPQ